VRATRWAHATALAIRLRRARSYRRAGSRSACEHRGLRPGKSRHDGRSTGGHAIRRRTGSRSRPSPASAQPTPGRCSSGPASRQFVRQRRRRRWARDAPWAHRPQLVKRQDAAQASGCASPRRAVRPACGVRPYQQHGFEGVLGPVLGFVSQGAKQPRNPRAESLRSAGSRWGPPSRAAPRADPSVRV
jgi:hypothetical protein